ncbi:STAS domain-containing protein [Streptomyces sp. NPDC006552]|uniref:STAS domain-containing protein n=1 Tax=Streptomyces sp. NPDC006552 TaxID=3157179 RepID=UPI00339EEBE5
MTTPLTLTHSRRSDGAVVLTAVGEIDMSNTADLAAALERIPGRLVLDLGAVEYLDSAGLSVLFPHAERLELISNPLLDPVLDISGLTELTARDGS